MSLVASINTSAVIVVAALVVVYAWGAWRSASKIAFDRKFLFGCSAFALLMALGPLDAIGVERRFFVILMVEHFVLAMVVPPLLLTATPAEMLRPWMLSRPLKPVFRSLTSLFACFVLFSILFAGPHYPLLLDAACRDSGLRLALNLLLVLAGLIMWWPLLNPLPEFPRPPYAYRILYLFLLLIPATAVASPLTLSHTVLYSWYAHGAHPMNLTPMEDQVLGGIFMWISLGFYLVGVFSALFFRWSLQEDAASRTTPTRPGPSGRPTLKVVTTPRARP